MTAAAQLGRFRLLMASHPALQEELIEPDDTPSFIALAVTTVQRHGIDLSAGQLAALMQGPRRGSTGRHDDHRLPPEGWLPVCAEWHSGQLDLEWIFVGSRQLSDPFFEDTVARCRAKPFNRLLRYATPIGTLAHWLQQHPGLPPAGFIFHMSRCGSTLVAQMLASLPDSVVVSEAGPIDAVVRARTALPDLDDARHVQWLRWIVGALGQPRTGRERRLFVKLDSWHSLMLPLFRRAFPDVPWIFVYREPLQVLASHMRQRGLHTVPGLIDGDLFGLEAVQSSLAPEQFCAQVLARICDGAAQHYPLGKGLLVNYRSLPDALWSDVLPHFGVACNASDRVAVADGARRDAKRPELPFSGDDGERQALASKPILQSAAVALAAPYAKLESLRLGGRMATPVEEVIDIASPRGLLRLRSERDGDAAFSFQLFCSARPELAWLPLDAQAWQQLMEQQFHAQSQGGRAAHPRASFYVVERAGAPIGRIVVDRSRGFIHIVDLALLPSERDHGHGSAIMRALMREAGEHGQPLRLSVALTNTAAMRLYTRLGFFQVGCEPSHFEMEWRAPQAKNTRA